MGTFLLGHHPRTTVEPTQAREQVPEHISRPRRLLSLPCIVRSWRSAAIRRGFGVESRRASEDGFTLLELLVVIVIIGLLIGLVAPAVLRQLGNARTSVAKQSVERLASVLDLYKLDVGTYPSTGQGLEALLRDPGSVAAWNGPYLQGNKMPVDPWNHPYLYQNPSVRQGVAYDLCSHGPSNVQVAPGQSGMICNQ